MTVTFGILAAFFALTVIVLQITFRKDKDFTDYAVGGRSFGGAYQAMSFLNTWYPGAVFIAFTGLTVSAGVIGFYVLSYSLLTIVLMYVIARRVWLWGRVFDLRTQPDLFSLRYRSHNIRLLTGLVGIVASFPWLVLGLQAMGLTFEYLSLHQMSFSQAVYFGVAVLAVRQLWTIRMGMRGVIISDMVQGIAAYVGGALMLVWLLIWLVADRGINFSTVDPQLLRLPGPGSQEGSLYVFALILSGAIGGWCWPSIFVRLFTADGVKSMKQSAAWAIPLSLIFCSLLLVFALLASSLPDVAAKPEDAWFIANYQAGGAWMLGFAGVAVFAATVGNVDGAIQASGAQIANDLVGNYYSLRHKQLVLISKGGMLAITLLAAWVATRELPALFTLAVLAYQGIIQLAVMQFLGIFWKRGNLAGAASGVIVGFAVAVILEFYWPNSIPELGGLTGGIVGLACNTVIYVLCAYLFPHSSAEQARIDRLFEMTRIGAPSFDAPLSFHEEVKARGGYT